MKKLNIYRRIEELVNFNLRRKILYSVIFLSIFINPNLLKASDEIKNQEENSILIRETKSKDTLQKDL